jgi:hypothetical protein
MKPLHGLVPRSFSWYAFLFYGMSLRDCRNFEERSERSHQSVPACLREAASAKAGNPVRELVKKL